MLNSLKSLVLLLNARKEWLRLSKFLPKLKRQYYSISQIGKEMMLIHKMCIKLKKGKSLEQISEELEETYSVIEGIMKKIEEFAPDYDEEKIIKTLFGHTNKK